MSQHHSRAEKTEGHLRKQGRQGSFGQKKNFSGGGKGGGGGGGGSSAAFSLSASAAPPPSLASHASPSNQSFKKSDNGQGGQFKGSSVSSNSDPADRTGHDGAYSTVLSNGSPVAPAIVNVKPEDPANSQKISKTVPKAVVTHSPPVTSGAAGSSAQVKGDASGGFLQFGTINPGIVNGMQIPARTTSAPPNLDEQKRDLARHDSLSAAPTFPIPSVPKPQQLQKQENQQARKVVDGVNKPYNGETRSSMQAKKAIRAPIPSAPPPNATTRTSVLPAGGMPMPVPFQQPPIHFQFNGPNPPIPSQSSLQMTSHQMFVPNIQPHPLQPQAIMHQGQGLGFTPQLGHQISPQLGSMGIGISPQFPNQQPGNIGTQRRAVKITHPDTHEELKLEKRTDSHTDAGASGQRQLQNISSQSQPVINYYKAPYNPSQMFFPQSSLHLTNTQMPTGAQAARYGYAVGQNGQAISFMNSPSLNTALVGRAGPPLPVHSEGSSFSTSSPAAPPVQVTIKPAVVPVSEKSGVSSVRVSLPVTRSEQPKLSKLSEDVSSFPHQKNNKIDLESSVTIKKPTYELSGTVSISAIDDTSSTVSSTTSTQISKTETSPSLHSATVGDSLSAMAGNDTGNKEALQRLKSSEREARPQKQQDMIGAHNDNGTSESVSDDRASIPNASTSGPSVFSLENADVGYDHMEVALNKQSFKEAGGNPLSSTSSNLNASEIVSETPSSVLDGCMIVEFEPKQENLIAAKELGGEVSDAVLLGSSSASGESLACTAGSLQVPEIVNHELKGQTHEKSIGDELDTSEGINSEVDNDSSFSICVEAKVLPVDFTISCELTCGEEIEVNKLARPPPESIPTVFSEIEQNVKSEVVDQSLGNFKVISRSNDNLEPTKAKTNKKKKIREILSKADAAGASDLYNAYKSPKEKHDTSETDSRCSTAELKNDISRDYCRVAPAVEEDERGKAELQDWEEAADTSTPELRTLDNDVEKQNQIDQGNQSNGKKKYSRDFLLTFSHLCHDLPEGFENGSDIADLLMCSPLGITREPHFGPGRLIDRSSGASRFDKRIGGISDDDKWARSSNAFHLDLSHGTASSNFRHGQGVNNGVLRNPRVQPPNHFANGNGILSGPVQSLASQGGRGNPDIDRWQHAGGIQRGSFPSPQQIMHKSSNRYEVGKSSDEEEQKQRRLKAILNKLTPQNFEKLFAQVKDVKIDNRQTLTGVISQIFDKALMEPTFCEMYADFCLHLASELPVFFEDNEKITFRRLLLNKCQEEFERGEREQAEANKAEEEGEIRQTEEEREEKRIRARRRMLGNIRLIGELYKKKMLTERIMHECIQKLLGYYQVPDEEDIESLCKLMSTIGVMIDHSKAKEHMDAYFDRMAVLSTNEKLSSRVRFMLKDAIDLRKNKWQQRRKVEGPKKIEDVHKDAAQERQAQASRLARGPVPSSRRGAPVNFGNRGMTIPNSPSSQTITNSHGLPTHARGVGSQDFRHEDRKLYESRVMSVPLPQRPTDEGSITLGPQGGLAKGMSGRGLGLISSVPSVEKSSRAGDPHRLVSSGSNVITMSREDSPQKYMTERLSGGRPISSGGTVRESSQSKEFSEDALREKSISAIREFYSAKDEEEIVSCIKELNAPFFFPSMVSVWVTDSFERKILERDLLAGLLVNLSKTRNTLISRSQLIAGFVSALSSLEDAVNDAPKAAEFLGHIFGKIIVENVVSLKEIGKLICEGGEEPGSLVEFGLAAEVLCGILEFIKAEKGDSRLNEIRLEDFKPQKPTPKSKKLDLFL